MSEFGLGYRRDLEDMANIHATAAPLYIPQAFSAPKTICHRNWRRAKSQGHVGSCSGFARASGEEVLNFIGTGGRAEVFSAMYCYLTNQKQCGLFGSDQGAQIDGSLRASQIDGVCHDAVFPYPGEYVTHIPPAAPLEGKKHLIRKYAVMRSYDDCYRWLASGVGVILTGTVWTTGMDKVGRIMDLQDLGGTYRGGHARVIHGYGGPGTEPEVDSDGRPLLDDENSHGEEWGENGFCLIMPRVIDKWCLKGAVLIGISDLEVFGPRTLPTWDGVIPSKGILAV